MNTTNSEAQVLASLYQKSAYIRESSYDWKACADHWEKNDTCSGEDYYRKTLHEAVVEACGKEFAHYVDLIHPTLYSTWNEVLDWAKSVTGNSLPSLKNDDRDRFLSTMQSKPSTLNLHLNA